VSIQVAFQASLQPVGSELNVTMLTKLDYILLHVSTAIKTCV